MERKSEFLGKSDSLVAFNLSDMKTIKDKEYFAKAIQEMNRDVAYFEQKYQGRFLETPHIGYGNRKTKCVNEATLPIITCHPSCLERCAGTCYVLAICTIPRPNCRKCEAKNTVLRRIDPRAYYEHFFCQAEKDRLPIRLSDGGDFENGEQVKACIQAAERHPGVHAILYTKRIELLPELVKVPANLHVRYSSWSGDEQGEAYARSLGFNITHVVDDGSGNCPYQKSKARYDQRKREIARNLRAKGLDSKAASRQAEREADSEIRIWHCRNCAEHGTGCCSTGDIRFNVVGEAGWAAKAAAKAEKELREGENHD